MRILSVSATVALLLAYSACYAEENASTTIAEFSGQIKTDDERSAESLELAQKFNTFMFQNDGKKVKLDIFNYYDPDDENLKTLDGGFPDPREFYALDDCETLPICTGSSYTIEADIEKLDYDPSYSARYIRGIFSVEVLAIRQATTAIHLKHIAD